METFYVFQHGFAAISDMKNRPIDEIFGSDKQTYTNPELIGNPCLFKVNQFSDGFNFGNLIIDQDLQRSFNKNQIIYQFPIAEYLFYIHRDSFREIDNTYENINTQLQSNNLNAIFHPILVFPNDLPASIYDDTVIEIWLATDSDYNSGNRLSETLPVALPRKHFNFYTW